MNRSSTSAGISTGNHSSGGTPFLDGRNTAQAEGQNLVVYGHNMLDGSMFKPIVQYLEPNFRQAHQDIYLELGGAQYRYQVLAVLETTVESPVYRYTDLSDPAAESDFRCGAVRGRKFRCDSPHQGVPHPLYLRRLGRGHQGAGGGKSAGRSRLLKTKRAVCGRPTF